MRFKLGLIFGTIAFGIGVPVQAQYSQSRYEYCHQSAVEFSVYEGRVPNRYLRGGPLAGAAKGAVSGAVGSAIFGGNKKERRRSAKRGAIIGGIVGAIKHGEAKAGAFMLLDQFETLEEAVYFSVVSFTTLGFGDVVIGNEWRLLSGIMAANGLILFSLVTAFLIEFIVRLRGAGSK